MVEDTRMLQILERIDARLERLEKRLEVLEQAEPMLATAVDTLDGQIAKLQSHGIDIDERLAVVVEATERLTRPETLEALDRALELSQELPNLAATAIDTMDGQIAKLQARGIDVDQRMAVLLEATERLTRPETLEALDKALELTKELPGLAATAVDTMDGQIAKLQAGGIDVDERMGVLLEAAERLSRPETLASLDKALELSREMPGLAATAVDTMDGQIAKLQARGIDVDQRLGILLEVTERLTRPEALEGVEQLMQLSKDLPNMAAAAVDTVDNHIANLYGQGIDVDDRLRRALVLTERVTRPATLEGLERLIQIVDNVPGMAAMIVDTVDNTIERLQERGIDLDDRMENLAYAMDTLTRSDVVRTARNMAEAMEMACKTRQNEPIGPFALMKATKEPEITRTITFTLQFARLFGATLTCVD